MKFSCNTLEFLQAIQRVSRAIGSTQALPILGNILLEASNNTCTVSATDLEISIITKFSANIETEGRITVPAKTLINFVQYNTDPEVKLEVKEGSQLHCSSHKAKAVIAAESANDYPNIAAVEKQSSFTLQALPFLRALSLVTFASAKTSLRPVLSGVSMLGKEGKITLVATDSYRLSEYVMDAHGVSDDLACIVPAKILEELKVVLGGMKPDKAKDEKIESEQGAPMVEISLGKQQIEFITSQTRLVSRLIDGRFPDYTRIIPTACVTKIGFIVSELLPAIRRMHYFAKEVNNKLTFTIQKEATIVATPQTQAGRDEATLQTELTGEENTIALSSSYLLDLLSHIDGDVLSMEVQDSLHPAIFRLLEEPQFLHLIMPLRIQES